MKDKKCPFCGVNEWHDSHDENCFIRNIANKINGVDISDEELNESWNIRVKENVEDE